MVCNVICVQGSWLFFSGPSEITLFFGDGDSYSSVFQSFMEVSGQHNYITDHAENC